MVILTIPSYVSRIESKDLKFFFILVELFAAFSVLGVRQYFSTTYEGSIGSKYFNHGRWDILSEHQKNKMQLKFLACPTGKYHSSVF
jgi:hypothetical protein